MAETIFFTCNSIAFAGWMLLIFVPKWRLTTTLITTVLIPLSLAIVYVSLVATNLASSGGGFGSLEEVGILFQNPPILLAGWVHYLAFDLFVGSWQVRDAQQIGISHYAVVPCLVLTFLLGPTGLLVYFIFRISIKRQGTLPMSQPASER